MYIFSGWDQNNWKQPAVLWLSILLLVNSLYLLSSAKSAGVTTPSHAKYSLCRLYRAWCEAGSLLWWSSHMTTIRQLIISTIESVKNTKKPTITQPATTAKCRTVCSSFIQYTRTTAIKQLQVIVHRINDLSWDDADTKIRMHVAGLCVCAPTSKYIAISMRKCY